MPTTRTLAVIGAAVIALTVALPSPATAAAGTSATPSAMKLVKAMDQQPGVRLTQRRDEGPDAVVADGFCSHLAIGGCIRGLITKDATLLVFDTVANASGFRGCGDDTAEDFGRMVVSFGNPPRMGVKRQHAYKAAIRHFRHSHPLRKNDLVLMQQRLMAHGLPMRDAHIDTAEERPGLATGIPGAVNMALTKQVDVIVFGTRTDASAYAGNADDQTYRRGRVVLSFGNPALLGSKRQATYAAALRHALKSPAAATAALASAGAAQPQLTAGCGG
jgi:hypothetical protein